MVAIRSVLDLPNEEPETEDAISVASPLADNIDNVIQVHLRDEVPLQDVHFDAFSRLSSRR